MTEPRDELLERYAEAAAQDPRRPSERVRHAARAHAQMLRDQASETQRAQGMAPTKTAANQPRWTLSLAASLAVVGLAGLLYLQIDRGVPEDREIALGAPTPAHTPAPVASPGPAAEKAVTSANPPPVTNPSPQNAAPSLAKAAPTPRVYSAVPAEADAGPAQVTSSTTAQIASAETVARDGKSETRGGSATRSAAAPAAPAAATSVTAAAPPAPALADTSRRAREMAGGTATEQFLQAARSGQVETLQKLLTGGVAINTRDDRGNTALMLAVGHRQLHAVRTLLDKGADPALVNNEGLTALRLASQMDMPDMLQLLQTPR